MRFINNKYFLFQYILNNSEDKIFVQDPWELLINIYRKKELVLMNNHYNDIKKIFIFHQEKITYMFQDKSDINYKKSNALIIIIFNKIINNTTNIRK